MEVQNIFLPARGNKSSIKRNDFSARRTHIELCFLDEDISTVELYIMANTYMAFGNVVVSPIHHYMCYTRFFIENSKLIIYVYQITLVVLFIFNYH